MRRPTHAVLVLTAALAAMLSLGAQAADSPQDFVTKAAQAGLAEVQAGQLAQSSASGADVKSFADRMVKDHQQANTELQGIARRKGLNVPADIGSAHMQAQQQLKGRTGKDFDDAYASQMAMDHAQAVALFQSNAANSDADLAAFAKKTLPVLQEHKRMADKLAAAHKK